MKKLMLCIVAALLGGATFACGSSESAAGRRGQVIDVSQEATYTRDQIQSSLDQLAIPEVAQARYGLAVWRVTYRTIDAGGAPTTASGLVFVPDGARGPRPVISDQHGTETLRLTPDSTVEDDGSFFAGFLLAPQGYLVVAADYLGLGTSPGLHPYYDAASEASATVDMLVATRAAAPRLHTELGRHLFLSGYSQGAHVTMALQRELERADHGFTVTASAPMAGAYDLSGTSVPAALASPAPLSPFYLSYLVLGLNQRYHFVDDPSEAFQAPYDTLVAGLFDGAHTEMEIAAALPADPNDLLQPALVASVTDGGGFLDALRANDVYDWTPKAPVRMFSGGADRDVPIENAKFASAHMRALGADVELVNVGDALDHDTAAQPSYLAAKSWFDSFANAL